ncbi:MAG TPA: PH domain-containing protein, partial [Methanothrix soehngenii]|nr:PH domain-containing protein [Methanothrix soehngenii]
MGYVEKNLMEGERLIAKASLHWIVFLGAILWGLVILLFVIGSGSGLLLILVLIGLGWAYTYYSSAEFAVTNRRVIAKWGVISRHSVEMNLDKVEGVSVNEGIIGSKLGYGTVIVNGTGGSHEAFPSI